MPVLSGEVIDRFTGSAVAGALVNIDGYRAYTGAGGYFSISIPEGTYTVTVSAPGYDTETTSVTVTEDTSITILLTPIAHTL